MALITPSNTYPIFFEKDFLILLETHLQLIMQDTGLSQYMINGHLIDKYIGDFYSLLDEIKLEKKYHWITMRCNNFNSPTDYQGGLSSIIIPNLRQIESLVTIYNSRKI